MSWRILTNVNDGYPHLVNGYEGLKITNWTIYPTYCWRIKDGINEGYPFTWWMFAVENGYIYSDNAVIGSEYAYEYKPGGGGSIDNNDDLANQLLNSPTDSSRMLNYYLMDIGNIETLKYVISTSPEAQLKNPLQYVVSLYKIPKCCLEPLVLTPTGTIVMGDFTADIQTFEISISTGVLSYETFTIDKKYNNFLDYEPYTSIQLYIPMFGITDIPCVKVMGGEIYIEIRCDYTTGDGIAYIFGVLNGIHTLIKSIRANLYSSEILSADTSLLKSISVLTSVGGGIAGAVTAGMSGNAIGAVGSAVGGLVGSFNSIGSSSVRTAGSLGTNVTFHTPTKYCVYINRPNVTIPETFGHENGYACFTSGKLSGFHGFTICDNPHIDNIACYGDEKDMISRLLTTGIILP